MGTKGNYSGKDGPRPEVTRIEFATPARNPPLPAARRAPGVHTACKPLSRHVLCCRGEVMNDHRIYL